ncbi:MAG: hypothetical protein ABSF78_06645 [Candidatus Acidiferrales bacterium]|jgi:streptogramin lyase
MADEKKRDAEISRRDFARSAALVAASAACLPSEVLARPLTATPAATETTSGAPAAQQQAKLSPESQAEAEEKIQAILRTRGERLSEAQKAEIRRLVTEGQAPLEKMREFPLDNGDQPGNVLRLYPDPPETRRTPTH